MKRLSKEHVCYRMSADNKPALTVAPGQAFCMETEDCYSGSLKTMKFPFPKNVLETLGMDLDFPATP